MEEWEKDIIVKNMDKLVNKQTSRVIYTSSISYDVNTVLGNGSLGSVVYKGKFGERDVAVKKVHLNLFGGTQTEALHVVKVLKDVDAHEYVVRYFAAEQSKEFVLIALELCEMSLNEWIENNGNGTSTLDKHMEISVRMEVLRQITVGLEWLHSKKILHKHIKPENVLLHLQMKRAKLSDFGLNTRLMNGKGFEASNAGVNNPRWIAPEILDHVIQRQNTECKFTYASDVFSLGCVYYYVVTGGKYAFEDSVNRQANILDGNSLTLENETKHVSAESAVLLLIEVMISEDRKARPICETLLSYPIFPQKDSRVGLLDNTSQPDPEQKEKQRLNKADLLDYGPNKTESPPVQLTASPNSKNTEAMNSISRGNNCILPIKKKKINKFFKNLKVKDFDRRRNKLFDMVRSEDLCIIKRDFEQGGAECHVEITEIGDQLQRTLLHVAVARGDYDIVEYLINYKGFESVLSKPISRDRVLHDCTRNIHIIEAATFTNKIRILELLFSKQPNLINSGEKDFWEHERTPLHKATRRLFTNGKQLEFIQFLVKHNANCNAKTKMGNTPLHSAVQTPVPPNVIEIIQFLIRHGADTDVVNVLGHKFWHKNAAKDVPPDLHTELLNYLVSIKSVKQEDVKIILGSNF